MVDVFAAFKSKRHVMTIEFPPNRQDSDNHRALPNQNLRACSRRHLRPHGVRLHVHLVLLLHEKMDAATKNDALSDSPNSPPESEASTFGRGTSARREKHIVVGDSFKIPLTFINNLFKRNSNRF
jgi:hypothetical protein